MSTNTLVMSLSASSTNSILLGGTFTLDLTLQNQSTSNKLYNLSLSLLLPDGLYLASSTVPQSTTITGTDNTTTYSFTNLKDLAPLEIDYVFSITIQCSAIFKSGASIPIDYVFSNIQLIATVDTMPRGSYDYGNEIFTTKQTISFTTVAYWGTIITSTKVLKGAGSSVLVTDALTSYTATVQLLGNASFKSTVAISILLDDGIRYLGNLLVSGTDSSKFTSPVINHVRISGRDYTELSYGSITLSQSSVTTIRFQFAVWNRYNNNTGSIITHGTKLSMSLRMGNTASSYSMINNFSFSAMDMILMESMNYTVIDLGYTLQYGLTMQVGQYDMVSQIRLLCRIPDGIGYQSSSLAPYSIESSAQQNGTLLTYDYAELSANTSTTITVTCIVNAKYFYRLDASQQPLPVVAYDQFTSACSLTGTIHSIPMNVSDSASVSCHIGIGVIKKTFIKGYYRDGSPKPIATLAPNDFAEYLLRYDASSLLATQKQIYLDDFFPLAANPIDSLSYTYTGSQPVLLPALISPHGVDFNYGDIPGKQTATIQFKVPISTLGSPAQNNNLFKLTGTNTLGYSYSARDQVLITIGSPNLTLTKSVSGPNKSAIQALETYTYTVLIKNNITSGTETDAFSFTLSDSISTWCTLNSQSIAVSGTGSYSSIDFTNSSVTVSITKLSPGASLTLTYSVTIKELLPPGLTITTTASNTNPYSQAYTALLTNYQYTNLNKSASVSLYSKPITVTKTTNQATFKVGSIILYTITITIPVGTIAYDVIMKDTLPTGQTYLGPAYSNDIPVTPTISSNTITFPSEATIDARLQSQSRTYRFYVTITNAIKLPDDYASTQTNTCQCLYRLGSSSGTLITIAKSLQVVVNHPNIILNLTALDQSTKISSQNTLSITADSRLFFSLSMYNNSMIDLINGTIELPISTDYTFFSIDTTSLCSANYDPVSRKVIIMLTSLPTKQYAQLNYTVLPITSLHSGTAMTTTATMLSYYNDLTTQKVYGGQVSNTITCTMEPNVSLVPDPATSINSSTSYILTPPGELATIRNFMTNTGGGMDSFRLTIASVPLDYILYIDETKIAEVPKNTVYSSSPVQLQNLPILAKKSITMTTFIPVDSSLGSRYDFVVTTTSLTSPYPSRTVLNIDPS